MRESIKKMFIMMSELLVNRHHCDYHFSPREIFGARQIAYQNPERVKIRNVYAVFANTENISLSKQICLGDHVLPFSG